MHQRFEDDQKIQVYSAEIVTVHPASIQALSVQIIAHFWPLRRISL
ncbi:hypothetical protein [Pseudomonas sp.]|nr:hypothetical protein [Pseudomonas sp.]